MKNMFTSEQVLEEFKSIRAEFITHADVEIIKEKVASPFIERIKLLEEEINDFRNMSFDVQREFHECENCQSLETSLRETRTKLTSILSDSCEASELHALRQKSMKLGYILDSFNNLRGNGNSEQNHQEFIDRLVTDNVELKMLRSRIAKYEADEHLANESIFDSGIT